MSKRVWMESEMNWSFIGAIGNLKPFTIKSNKNPKHEKAPKIREKKWII